MIQRFERLSFAHIQCKASILMQGMPDNETIMIGCFGYYIEKDGRRILIDTGIESIDTVNLTKSSKDDWARDENEFNLTDNLRKIGVDPDSIDEAFITHSHYDHLSGVCNLKKANIYLSESEYEYLQQESNPHNKFLKDVILFLADKEKKGKLILIEKEYVSDGIRCITVGGHTPGSMLVFVDDHLFTGDSIFLLDSIEKKKPIGFCNEPEKAEIALEYCLEHKGKIFTGHDFRCLGSGRGKNV